MRINLSATKARILQRGTKINDVYLFCKFITAMTALILILVYTQ